MTVKRFVLGLTGSIGMGKTTTAEMLRAHGAHVWDADRTVHGLYAPDGAATAQIQRYFPAVTGSQGVDRTALRRLIASDPGVLDTVQSIVHPLVEQDRQAFLAAHQHGILVLDIPLLFEAGADSVCDAVAVVSASPEEQRARVLARGDMSEAEFQLILARQMPDAEKRSRARWVIDTNTIESARRDVQVIVDDIGKALDDA